MNASLFIINSSLIEEGINTDLVLGMHRAKLHLSVVLLGAGICIYFFHEHHQYHWLASRLNARSEKSKQDMLSLRERDVA